MSKLKLVPVKPVRSSQIEAIGYDEKREVLQVNFISGGIYQYKPVTPELYSEFRDAKSKGGWFDINIKKSKKFKVTKF